MYISEGRVEQLARRSVVARNARWNKKKPDLNAAALATLVAQCQRRAVNTEISNAVNARKCQNPGIGYPVVTGMCVVCVYCSVCCVCFHRTLPVSTTANVRQLCYFLFANV
jgi:hypothetical protein